MASNVTTVVSGTYTTTQIVTSLIVSWSVEITTTTVSNYTIMIGCANGTWAPTTHCNGASSTVIANQNCTIPMSVLTQAPFSLTVNSSVFVMVNAAYSNGTSYSLSSSSSSYSSTTTTTAYVSPSPPGTPVTSNSGTNIIITWTAPTIGAPILNYTIMIGTISGTWATTSACDGASTTTIANL